MSDEAARSAGIIIIGNEILSGKVLDVNSYYLASELRALGIDVRRISVVPDEVDIIGKEALSFSSAYDHVFTTGGVGPTHDDVTMEGIASGFSVRLLRSPLLESILRESCSPLNSAVMKMADIPEGAEVIFNSGMRFPVVKYRNVYIFPGIPKYLKAKFPFIRDELSSSLYFLRRIFLNAREADLADTLRHVEDEFAEISIGSYPVVDKSSFNLVVTVESRDEGLLDRAFGLLTRLIPPRHIVRTE